MSRVQLIRAAYVLGAAVAAVAFTIVKKGNDFSVTADVTSGGVTPVTISVGDDSGKVRVFKDVDDFIKAASKLSLINSGSVIAFSFTNPGAMEAAVFTGDIVKRTQSVIASYQANVLKLTETSTALATAIALLPSATPGEIAYKAEKTTQKAAVDANKTYLQAEVVRLTALIA